MFCGNLFVYCLSELLVSSVWVALARLTFGMDWPTLLKRQPQLTLLNTLPGIAIEAVAALFFKQAEDTRKRATELYDRLRLDDKQTQAITLIESIENQELRDFVKAQWALQIVGLESHAVDFAPYSYKLPLPNESVYKGEQKKSSLTEKENPSTGQFIR